MIIDGVVGLHELVSHDPVVFSVDGTDLHVVGVQQQLALALAFVLEECFSWKLEGGALLVISVSQDLHVVGRNGVVVLAGAVAGGHLGGELVLAFLALALDAVVLVKELSEGLEVS